MKSSIKDFFSKCDQIRNLLQIWPFTVKILNEKQFLHDVPYVTYGDPLRGQVERYFNPRLNQRS